MVGGNAPTVRLHDDLLPASPTGSAPRSPRCRAVAARAIPDEALRCPAFASRRFLPQ